MNPIIEAMQILSIDEPLLFRRAHGWFYGATASKEETVKRLYDSYRATRVYPACVLAYIATVRRMPPIKAAAVGT
jgi:hypothetical protein